MEERAEASGFVTLGSQVREVLGSLEAGDPELSLITGEPECASCGDFFWVRRDVPVTDPRFGIPVRCGICGVATKDQMERLFKRAGVPKLFCHFTLETYPVTDATRQAWIDCLRWATMLFEEIKQAGDESLFQIDPWRKHGLFLHGPYGSGKTGLAVGTLRQYQESLGSQGLFVRVPDLMDEIRATYAPDSERSEAKLMDLLRDVDLVVLDDLGAERPTEWVREKLYTIIGHRHDEMLDTIFTSNLSLEALAEQIGERTVHRIAEMCRVVEVAGPNLRARGA